MKELAAKTLANFASRSFEFNISYSDPSLPLDRDFFASLVDPVLKLLRKNFRTPFKMTIDFKGIQAPSHDAIVRFSPAILKMVSEYFVRWAQDIFSYQVSEDDKRKISQDQYSLLSETARQHYDIFISSLIKYMSLLYSSHQDKMKAQSSL